MSVVSNWRVATSTLLLALAALAVPGAVEARESLDDLYISSPLFKIEDVWPAPETTPPAIEPFIQETEALPAENRPLLEPQTPPLPPAFSVPAAAGPQDIVTEWGYGVRENKYNAAIFKATDAWPHSDKVPLHPLLLKSLLACESGFDPLAVSYTGAMGIAQLTPETARRFGLDWSSSRDPQRAIPAGVKVLAEKAQVVLYPGAYHKLMGLPPERCLYAQKVDAAYQSWGEPSVEQYWHLMLAAYNGGGGTILRAMAVASDRGLDPREWSNLVGDSSNPQNTPLYLACREIFGRGAANKYREVANYPLKVLKLYNKSVPAHHQVKLI